MSCIRWLFAATEEIHSAAFRRLSYIEESAAGIQGRSEAEISRQRGRTLARPPGWASGDGDGRDSQRGFEKGEWGSGLPVNRKALSREMERMVVPC
jgi:hypothetical protein